MIEQPPKLNFHLQPIDFRFAQTVIPPIMIVNLSDQHSLVSNWVAELRDVNVQGDRLRFRRNLERIGEIAAYEISKELPWQTVEVPTPLGSHDSKLLTEQPVLATILRAGLPL